MKHIKLAIITSVVSLTLPCQSAVVISVDEVGSDVVLTTSGSLDLTGAVTNSNVPTINGFAGAWGDLFIVFTSRPSSGTPDTYDITAPAISPHSGNTAPLEGASSVGTNWGIEFGSTLHLPTGYSSGDDLSTTLTFANKTLDDLGYSAGSFAYSLPNDTVTFNIAPEPTSSALVGLAGLAFFTRRRRS